jgi:hypothetical protein
MFDRDPVSYIPSVFYLISVIGAVFAMSQNVFYGWAILIVASVFFYYIRLFFNLSKNGTMITIVFIFIGMTVFTIGEIFG